MCRRCPTLPANLPTAAPPRYRRCSHCGVANMCWLHEELRDGVWRDVPWCGDCIRRAHTPPDEKTPP